MFKTFKRITTSVFLVLSLFVFSGVQASAQATQNIVEIASGNDDFETLVTAVTTAELQGVLAGPGPFTVFAPTDDAFAALPDGLVEALLLPENRSTLIEILQYHVVSGSVDAAQVVTLNSATTLEGSDVSIAVDGGNVTLNGSVNVTQTDIAATNGFIHIIDGVLVPSSVDVNALLATNSVDTTIRSGGANYLTFASLGFLTMASIVAVGVLLKPVKN